MDNTVLEINHVIKEFPGVIALKDVSFTIKDGEVHALVGENGAGKSTLIKILAGVYSDYSGEILLAGKKVVFHSPTDAQHQGISTIFQELTLVPQLSVAENIFLGREPVTSRYFVNKRHILEESQALLNYLGSSIKPTQKVSTLSVANQQIVEICKSLAFDARVIIMDEPTASLTEHEVQQLFVLIEKLKKRGKTICYVSHRLKEVFSIADRVTVLRDGKYIDTKNISETSSDQVVQMMVGRSMESMYPERNAIIGDRILTVRRLTRTGEFSDISFDLHCGEILGVGGLIGAGRTELAKTIIGLKKPDSGEISVGTVRTAGFRGPAAAMRVGISYLPEDRKAEGLFHQLSIKENITLPVIRHFARLASLIDQKRELTEVERLMKQIRIAAWDASQRVETLSGGNQQKAVISRLLATGSKVFIFDEPTRGVDVGAKHEIYTIMEQLSEQGNSILFISSEMEELLGISDRILLLRAGRLMKTVERSEFNPELIMKILTHGIDPAGAYQ